MLKYRRVLLGAVLAALAVGASITSASAMHRSQIVPFLYSKPVVGGGGMVRGVVPGAPHGAMPPVYRPGISPNPKTHPGVHYVLEEGPDGKLIPYRGNGR